MFFCAQHKAFKHATSVPIQHKLTNKEISNICVQSSTAIVPADFQDYELYYWYPLLPIYSYFLPDGVGSVAILVEESVKA